MSTMDWSVKVTDIAIVLATVAGPILAVWASEWRQARSASRDRQEWVFRTLWSTRSTGLNPDHVAAINHIEFAFPKDRFPTIDDAWRLYQDHLQTEQGKTEDSLARWREKANGLLVNLVHLMATVLGYPFDKSAVTKPSYYPEAYAINEARQRAIQDATLAVLQGRAAIAVMPPPDKAAFQETHRK